MNWGPLPSQGRRDELGEEGVFWGARGVDLLVSQVKQGLGAG